MSGWELAAGVAVDRWAASAGGGGLVGAAVASALAVSALVVACVGCALCPVGVVWAVADGTGGAVVGAAVLLVAVRVGVEPALSSHAAGAGGVSWGVFGSGAAPGGWHRGQFALAGAGDGGGRPSVLGGGVAVGAFEKSEVGVGEPQVGGVGHGAAAGAQHLFGDVDRREHVEGVVAAWAASWGQVGVVGGGVVPDHEYALVAVEGGASGCAGVGRPAEGVGVAGQGGCGGV